MNDPGVDDIDPDEHVSLRFHAPTCSALVLVLVVATKPVEVLAVPPRGRRAFLAGEEDFALFDASEDDELHILTFTPDAGQPWHLLLINNGKERVRVRYEVRW